MMKKLIGKFGKRFVIAYLIIDNACALALMVWYFSPYGEWLRAALSWQS